MKPNVLFIIDSFEQGGSERQALQLLRQLHASGRCRVHLACLQDRGSLRAEAEQLGIGEIFEYPLTSFYDLNFVRQLRRLRHFIKEHRIDVVHTHCFYTNIFGMTGAAWARVPARITSKGETEGFIKVLVDADTKQILGASILGTGGDEAIHCIIDTMYARAPYTLIQRAVHIHPAMSEVVDRAANNLEHPAGIHAPHA